MNEQEERYDAYQRRYEAEGMADIRRTIQNSRCVRCSLATPWPAGFCHHCASQHNIYPYIYPCLHCELSLFAHLAIPGHLKCPFEVTLFKSASVYTQIIATLLLSGELKMPT